MYTILCAVSLVELHTGKKDDCMKFAANYARNRGDTKFKLIDNKNRVVKTFIVTAYGFVI